MRVLETRNIYGACQEQCIAFSRLYRSYGLLRESALYFILFSSEFGKQMQPATGRWHQAKCQCGKPCMFMNHACMIQSCTHVSGNCRWLPSSLVLDFLLKKMKNIFLGLKKSNSVIQVHVHIMYLPWRFRKKNFVFFTT